MTTIERNARSLALLAPLACPTIDLLCALYVIVARQAHAIIEALKADHAARRALASHRAALLNPVHYPMNPPVLGDDDLIAEPALLRRLAELTAEAIGESYTVAACSPIDPAPERQSIAVDYVKVGEARLTDKGREINAHVDFVLAQLDRVDITTLSYRDLQAACKALGIKANQRADKLRAALIVRQRA